MDKIFADFGIGEVGNKSGEGVGLGIDHKKLTYRFQGLDFRLTSVHGHPIREIMT